MRMAIGTQSAFGDSVTCLTALTEVAEQMIAANEVLHLMVQCPKITPCTDLSDCCVSVK